MKKTIRLTESELVRLIKRIIKEESSEDPLSVIQSCCDENDVTIDLETITACASLGGEIPSPQEKNKKIMACLTSIASKAITLGPGALSVGTCVMNKLGMSGGGGKTGGGGINFGGISLPGTMGGNFPMGK